MIDLQDDEYGSRQFDMTQDDLNWVAEQLERAGTPQELTEIALRIIEGHQKPEADHGSEPAERRLLNDGERIRNHLAEALGSDPRFTSLEGTWFLVDKLPRLGPDALRSAHRQLLQNPSSSMEEILSVLKEGRSTDHPLLRMALHTAFLRSPERFENIGTPDLPQWRARLPEVEQADVTHYAYDPQTYEILCRPGQRLSQKKARRLQELDLYSYVVTFAD